MKQKYFNSLMIEPTNICDFKKKDYFKKYYQYHKKYDNIISRFDICGLFLCFLCFVSYLLKIQ